MDVDTQQMHHQGAQLKFGLAERWILAGAFTALMTLVGWVGTSFSGRLDAMSKSQQVMATQIAVANSQLTALRTQLADIPSMSQHLAQLQVQMQRAQSDIRQLQRGKSAR